MEVELTVQRATTRKRIASVKFTEWELEEILRCLGSFEYDNHPQVDNSDFKSAIKKLRTAKDLFIRHT